MTCFVCIPHLSFIFLLLLLLEFIFLLLVLVEQGQSILGLPPTVEQQHYLNNSLAARVHNLVLVIEGIREYITEKRIDSFTNHNIGVLFSYSNT
ncbi:hypothetical protein ACJX0J_028239, partial [Zea mays]